MPQSYDFATVELAMALSTLAYVEENRVASQQQMIGEIDAWMRRNTDLARLPGDQP